MDSNLQSKTFVDCPVCNEPYDRATLPPFCTKCAWDLETDPTIIVSIEPMSEEELNLHNQRISMARKNWEQSQADRRKAKELETNT